MELSLQLTFFMIFYFRPQFTTDLFIRYLKSPSQFTTKKVILSPAYIYHTKILAVPLQDFNNNYKRCVCHGRQISNVTIKVTEVFVKQIIHDK